MTKSLAQEVGRAGRDGAPSICEVFVCPDDLTVLENIRFFAEVRGLSSSEWLPRGDQHPRTFHPLAHPRLEAPVGAKLLEAALGKMVLDLPAEAVRRSTERLQQVVEAPITIGPDQAVAVGASIGVASALADDVVPLADKALYGKKRSKRLGSPG